ncbi:hypothetical protein QE379_003252 [Sphingomonas sp. SORGH_AS 879]|nr:hypothetical protein [Sphingomonas sp. SORGH_AS_0879]
MPVWGCFQGVIICTMRFYTRSLYLRTVKLA